MMQTNWSRGLLVAGIAGLLTACNTVDSRTAVESRHIPQNTINASHPRARLVLGSRDLVGHIAMLDVRVGDVGKLMRGEVSVQNLSNNRYTLEYQYAWEDSSGFSISENRVWRRFVLGPREIKSFQAVASSPDAYGFTMTVRLPDDIFIHQEKFIDRK